MSLLGLTRGELIFVGIVVFLVFGWAWLPRVGGFLGARLDKPSDPQS